MRLAEVLGALSLGTDMADGFRLEKAMRSAVLATRLADAAGAPESTRTDAYWASVVRFLGCVAFAPEEARSFAAGDDIGLRATLAKVDFGSLKDFAVRALPNIAKHAPLPKRVSALARLLGNPDAPRQHAEAQCEVGAHLVEAFALGPDVARALDLREERWDGKGPRRKARGEEIPLSARIADVADLGELFHGEGGVPSAVAQVKARRGGQLDPRLVDVFTRRAAELLAPLDAPSIVETFLEVEGAEPRLVDGPGLRRIATAYAHVVDLKSYWTAGHSTGVAALVERAGGSEDAILAALFHDLGNLAVPTGILDKPGPLTPWERERMRGHCAHTALVLRAAPSLAAVADIACGVHEYGGRDGYPRAVGPAALPFAARLLMAADVHHALRTPRAYRPAFTAPEAEQILTDMARRGRLCLDATNSVLGAHSPKRTTPRGLSDRELEVLRLVAIGRTNAEVGDLLGISPRTAQKHVQNLYDKLGIGSRAAAALFAAEHGLLEPH